MVVKVVHKARKPARLLEPIGQSNSIIFVLSQERVIWHASENLQSASVTKTFLKRKDS